MRLLELQLGRVLAGDDALVVIDVAREAIQERRLSRAGAPGNQHVAAHPPDDLEDVGARLRDGAELRQLIEGELILLELADREGRPIDRKRRHDHIDARPVRQAGIANRRGFVDAPSDLADDALTHIHQLGIVAETDRSQLNLAGHFDVGLLGTVDHHIGDVVARQQRFERAVAEHVVADIVEHVLLLGDRHHHILQPDDLADDVADFLACALGVELRELTDVDGLDQRAEDHAFRLIIIVRARLLARSRLRRRRGRRLVSLNHGERRRRVRARRRRRLGRGGRRNDRPQPWRRAHTRGTFSKHQPDLNRPNSLSATPPASEKAIGTAG